MRATMDHWTSRRSARPAVRLAAVGLAFFLSVSFSASGLAHTGAKAAPRPPPAAGSSSPAATTSPTAATGRRREPLPRAAARRPAESPGWCLYNQGKNGQTSSTYISAGGLASAYNMRPDLLTLQLGEQNATIVKLVTDCFDKVKDHDFAGANTCAAQILGNSSLWTSLKNNYTTILQQTRIMTAQRPSWWSRSSTTRTRIPKSTDVVDEIARCACRSSTRSRPAPPGGPSCRPHWPSSTRSFKKLNTTLKESLAPFKARVPTATDGCTSTRTPSSTTTA